MKKTRVRRNADFTNSATFQEDVALMKAQGVVNELLDKSGLNQKALAKKMEVSPSQICRLFDEERNLTLRSFVKICFHLGHEVTFGFRSLMKSEGLSSYWTFPYVKAEEMHPTYRNQITVYALPHKTKNQRLEKSEHWGTAFKGFRKSAEHQIPYSTFVPTTIATEGQLVWTR
ncbi:MAG: helix-turn-helix transcriptional regulator [Bdellovibrionota bacterium]